MLCSTYLDTILSSEIGLEISIIILFGIALIAICYFFKKYWASFILIFILAAILKAYLLRSDILDDLFGKYIKQEPRYILRIFELFGLETIAIVVSYYFIIKKIVFSRNNILIILSISTVLSFILGILIFSSVACP